MNNKNSQTGLTLLEVMVAVVILTVAVLGVVAAINSSVLLRKQGYQMTAAMNAARTQLSAIEQYCSQFGIPDTFTQFNGATFAVSYQEQNDTGDTRILFPLEPTSGTAVDSVGRVEFPGNPTTTFNEAQVATDLGMPRDLDGDTTADNTTVALTEMEMLPLRVIVEWKGSNGTRKYQISTVLPKSN